MRGGSIIIIGGNLPKNPLYQLPQGGCMSAMATMPPY